MLGLMTANAVLSILGNLCHCPTWEGREGYSSLPSVSILRISQRALLTKVLTGTSSYRNSASFFCVLSAFLCEWGNSIFTVPNHEFQGWDLWLCTCEPWDPLVCSNVQKAASDSSMCSLSLDFCPLIWHCPARSLVSQILTSFLCSVTFHLTCDLLNFEISCM